MCGGGGYRAPPDNSLEVQREQQAYADKSKQEEQARADAKAAADRAAFSSGLTSAQDQFRKRGTARLSTMGLDPQKYGSIVEDALMSATSAVPDLAPNVGNYFTDSVLDNSIGRYQGDQRNNFTRQVTSAFGDGFENNLFADTADDPFIESVLGRQRGEAVRALDMSRKRGNLDDTGYNAALSRLSEQEKAGRATANTLGGSVIQGYRKQVRDIGDRAKSAASGYSLGDTFDLGNYTAQRDKTVGDLSGRLEGDVNSALTGQNFFDIGDLITRGGSAQGATNPTLNLSGLVAERDRVRNTPRGVGNAGTF